MKSKRGSSTKGKAVQTQPHKGTTQAPRGAAKARGQKNARKRRATKAAARGVASCQSKHLFKKGTSRQNCTGCLTAPSRRTTTRSARWACGARGWRRGPARRASTRPRTCRGRRPAWGWSGCRAGPTRRSSPGRTTRCPGTAPGTTRSMVRAAFQLDWRCQVDVSAPRVSASPRSGCNGGASSRVWVCCTGHGRLLHGPRWAQWPPAGAPTSARVARCLSKVLTCAQEGATRRQAHLGLGRPRLGVPDVEQPDRVRVVGHVGERRHRVVDPARHV